ncbi:hypothetical protein FOL47_006895 [Perkinsus chesapeaki]|uniref:Uncharacterized protein n=1 Tax=Perkinsus chesapeaki TaxID=330153 RepID=A0A7J6LP00_PERCH|nr:hypothetical protein FOL47_006895 [Perkinsus chesapeaki]
MTGTSPSMKASAVPFQSLFEMLSEADGPFHRVLSEKNMSTIEAGVVISLIKSFAKQTACEPPPEDEEVYIQYWIDHYQRKSLPCASICLNAAASSGGPTTEMTAVSDSEYDMVYRIGRRDLVKLVYKFFAIRREVDWLSSRPLLPGKVVKVSSRSLSMSTIASSGRAEPSPIEPLLKPVSTLGSLSSPFGGVHSEDRKNDAPSKLLLLPPLQYTRVIDLFIACDADWKRLGDDGILPKDPDYRPSFFEGESKLVASDVTAYFKSIKDKAKWGLKGVGEPQLLEYLHNFIDGRDETFPILGAFEKQNGYRSLDVSSLFRFWASLTPYQKSSYRLRGLSRSQALDVITKIAEREIKKQKEAAGFAEQSGKDILERSKSRYLHILPTPLSELARPKRHTMSTESQLASMRLFQLLRRHGPNDAAVMAALAEYKETLGPHHSYDAFVVLLKEARKLRIISTIDSPSGRLPLGQGDRADAMRMSELHEAMQRHSALKRKVFTIVNHSVSRTSDLFGVTSSGFLEHLFADLCQAVGEDRICDLFGCHDIDRSTAIRVINAAISVGEDGTLNIEMKRHMPLVEVRIQGLTFDVLAKEKIIGRSDAKGIARFVAFERRLSIKMPKRCSWRGEQVEVSKLWKIAPPQFARYCSETLMKRIQSHRRWALSRHGLGFWAPLGRSVGACFNQKVHLSIEVNKASQYDEMVARLSGGSRIAKRMRRSTFMLNGEIDNCRFIPAAGGHAPGEHAAGQGRRSRTIDDFVTSLGSKSENGQPGCYSLIRRWGRVKRAKALCQQGYLLAAKTYLDKAFNVRQIMEHFACMHPGCLKPLPTSATPCKCGGMFCNTHSHPRCHSCHETGLRLATIIGTVGEMSEGKCGIEETFDDRTMLGLLLHVLEVSRTINEGLKRRRWGRIPGTTGKEVLALRKCSKGVQVMCGLRRRRREYSTRDDRFPRCSFARRNAASDRRLLRRALGRRQVHHHGSTKAITESDAIESFQQLRTSMAVAQRSSVERLSKPKPRPKAPQLSLVRRFKARRVPSSIGGRPFTRRSQPAPSAPPVVASSKGEGEKAGKVAQSIVSAIVERAAMSESSSTVHCVNDEGPPNPQLHLAGSQRTEIEQAGTEADVSGVVDAILVEPSDDEAAAVLAIEDKPSSVAVLPVIVEDPQLAITDDKNEAERWAQLSPREPPAHKEEGRELVYDPKKYTDEIVESDWLVERTLPSSSLSATRATKLLTKDSLSALFSTSIPLTGVDQTEGEDLEKLFASVDLNSL